MKRYQFSLPILFNTPQLFLLLHDKHFETNEKKLIELIDQLRHFITQSIDWYDGLENPFSFF